MITVSRLQLEKAAIPRFISLIVIEERPEQPANAYPRILLTELGNVIEDSPLHPEKAYIPIVLTEFPRVTDVISLQLSNSPSGI